MDEDSRMELQPSAASSAVSDVATSALAVAVEVKSHGESDGGGGGGGGGDVLRQQMQHHQG